MGVIITASQGGGIIRPQSNVRVEVTEGFPCHTLLPQPSAQSDPMRLVYYDGRFLDEDIEVQRKPAWLHGQCL